MTLTTETWTPVMPRCSSCKWWEQNPTLRSWGSCALAEVEHESQSLARAKGRDPGEGWLSTCEDFGCVQWEKRDS